MLFASAGYRVVLYDILPEQVSTALEEIEKELHALEAKSALRGTYSVAQQLSFISGTVELSELVSNAIYLQECIPERIEWKRKLYTDLAAIVGAETIIGSSTSTYMPSLFSEQMTSHRENVRELLNKTCCIYIIKSIISQPRYSLRIPSIHPTIYHSSK